jgi:choline dehydrogenase
MLYVRGNRWDYDHWASLGNPGWSYDEVLPLFKRSENNEQFHDELHGQGGPLNVTYPRFDSPLSQMFLDAAAQNGIALNPDYNGAGQEGSFLYQVTHKNGERCSAAKGLPDSQSGPTQPEGDHPRGQRQGGTDGPTRHRCAVLPGQPVAQRTCRREVIVSAGAFVHRSCCSSRASARWRTCNRPACTRCTNCQAWARTCGPH